MQTNMMRGEYLHQVALNGNLQQCLVQLEFGVKTDLSGAENTSIKFLLVEVTKKSD